jgi:malate dehydrogenase (oxaloacetate-decarboxylating)
MALAAARELAAASRARGLDERHIVPHMDDEQVAPRVAAATALAAQAEGVALLRRSREELEASATQAIRSAREITGLLFREGVIPAPPEEE